MRKFQSLDITKDLLPAIDDLGRALEFNEIKKNSPMLEAVEMIKSKIEKILERHSIRSFKSLDTDFNPNLHEAITTVPPTEECPTGKIVDVIEEGYMYKERLLKASKVVVSS